MPHVIVKLWPGKSDQQKARLAEKITKDRLLRRAARVVQQLSSWSVLNDAGQCAN
jgi:phenylpyruvate tautomerase PptA (4-oxalocrotonate tautomerase family)